QPRLHGHNLAFLKEGALAADAWGLMNVQADAVPGSMKIALHASVDQAGFITSGFEAIADPLVDFGPIRAVANFRDRHFLSILHGLIQTLQFRRGCPSDHGPGHVGEVAGLAGARKYRSEEHTSELQSRFDLVCRLLLEK